MRDLTNTNKITKMSLFKFMRVYGGNMIIIHICTFLKIY
jgi:hypothetical protein